MRIARLIVAAGVGVLAGWVTNHLVGLPRSVAVIIGFLLAIAILQFLSRTVYRHWDDSDSGK